MKDDAHSSPLRCLTRRELEVLVLLAQGLSNKQIAALLGVTRPTIGTHLRHVFAKLGVRNRVCAALVYLETIRTDQ